MSKNRLEAFTDAVIAIVITLLVLELSAPQGDHIADLWEMKYSILIYILSFFSLSIYWNNHHHLFQVVDKVDGASLWWNFILIFFLSLFPFTTAWVDRHLFSTAPQMVYGTVMLLTDIVWYFLVKSLVRLHGPDSKIAQLSHINRKSWLTFIIVIIGLVLGIFMPVLVLVFCALSLILWVIPDPKIEAVFYSNL